MPALTDSNAQHTNCSVLSSHNCTNKDSVFYRLLIRKLERCGKQKKCCKRSSGQEYRCANFHASDMLWAEKSASCRVVANLSVFYA